MAGNTIVFLSDIHIGVNASTNWYQQSIHEPYLKGILNYVQTNSNVQDLVILGDWFDLWTYLPKATPPKVADVINANLNIFNKPTAGPTPENPAGDFVSCLDSVQGKLCFVNGNHDMLAGLGEINEHFAPLSAKGKTVSGGTTPDGYVNGKVYGVHGHQYSLFCRPDPAEDPTYSGLPFGFFITRTSSVIGQNELNSAVPPLNNVAQLANQGQPLFNFTDIEFGLEYIIEIIAGPDPLAKGVLYDLLREAGVPEGQLDTYEYDMPSIPGNPNAPATITSGEVWQMFSKLWQGISSIPSLTVDTSDSLTLEGDNLLRDYDVVVMGHTHTPLLHHLPFMGIYANSGFNCAPQPDMEKGTQVPTFTEVVINENGSYTVNIKTVALDADNSATVSKVTTATYSPGI